MTELLFVYGTLRRGSSHDGMLTPHARYLGPATIPGRLYNLPAGYPAFVDDLTEPKRVSGDLWALERDAGALLARLDAYEEAGPDFPAPQEYERVRLDVRHDGRDRMAWVYVYRWPLEGATLIDSGDFLGEETEDDRSIA